MSRTFLVMDNAVKDRMRPFIQSLICEQNRNFSEMSLTAHETTKLNEYADTECFVVLFGEKTANSQAMYNVTAYCEAQHIPLIPIFSGEVLKLETLPESLQSRHILLADDPEVLAKTILAMTHPTFADGTLNDQIREAKNLWEKGCRSRMTAQQLFNYAFGLLYGIETERDCALSIRLQTSLIGNEVFEPDYFMLNHVTEQAEEYSAVFNYADALNRYITTEVNRLKRTTDYRSVEKLLGCGYLLQRISRQFLFNYHVDQVLRDLKSVMIRWCMEDHSAVADRWLTQYFWEAATRAADSREYTKMLDDLLEVLHYGAGVLEKHDDIPTKLYMLRASLVLGMYLRNRPDLIKKAVKIRVLDEYVPNNTFRPPHRTQARSGEESEIFRDLVSRYTCTEQEIVTRYFKDNIYSRQQELMKAITDAAKVLVFCKCNCTGDIFSVWFHRNMDAVVQSIPQDDAESYYMILVQYSWFADMLLNAPWPTASEALLHAAAHMDRFCDYHESKWVGVQLDKSQIYAMYCESYHEMKQTDLYDEYKLRLFKVVSKRDFENPASIRNMLIDCFHTAMRRKKQKNKNRCKEYLRFGWKCCQAYRPVPNWLEDVYEAYQDEVIHFRIESV